MLACRTSRSLALPPLNHTASQRGLQREEGQRAGAHDALAAEIQNQTDILATWQAITSCAALCAPRARLRLSLPMPVWLAQAAGALSLERRSRMVGGEAEVSPGGAAAAALPATRQLFRSDERFTAAAPGGRTAPALLLCQRGHQMMRALPSRASVLASCRRAAAATARTTPRSCPSIGRFSMATRCTCCV